ncbi:MAG: DinB family protein, partial [Leptospiraceae bacterium]|nr:DinB family protein [Leptospiraceae bacterium]
MIATSAESVECLLEWFKETRKTTVALCDPLQIEDHVVQSSPDVSPPSWHLGHTTWFFETFLLRSFARGYQLYDPAFSFLFNSYYEAEGARIQKINRGVLSRPGVAEIHKYRESVDAAMDRLFSNINGDDSGNAERILELTELGIHHEKQHQELLLMDIKH